MESQCGNCRNSLSHFFRKNFVKALVLPKELLNCWFDEIFCQWETISRFSTLWESYFGIFRSYFKDLDLHLPQLESIDLSNSGWLSNHSLQAIGKSDKLKRVILRGCKRIGEVFVYTALATRFGFQNTTYIDLRDTFGNLDPFFFVFHTKHTNLRT